MRCLGLIPPCLLAWLAVAAMADQQASAPHRQMIASAAEADGRHAPLIEADRAIARAYFARGRLYLQRGQLDKAIADFSSAVKLHPRDTSAYLERSAAYVRKGDLSSGMADFQKCMQLVSQQQDALTQELRGIKQSLRSLHEQPISIRRLQIPEAL